MHVLMQSGFKLAPSIHLVMCVSKGELFELSACVGQPADSHHIARALLGEMRNASPTPRAGINAQQLHHKLIQKGQTDSAVATSAERCCACICVQRTHHREENQVPPIHLFSLIY
jgi:hypothetical protein